jgi:hypothetical protein
MPLITNAQDVAKLGKASIEKVIDEMTLEEKVQIDG